MSAKLLPLEFFPSLDAPFLGIELPYPNSTPEEIERQITKPAEEVLATISGHQAHGFRLGGERREHPDRVRLGRSTRTSRRSRRRRSSTASATFSRAISRDSTSRKFSTSDMQMLILRISSDRDLSNAYDMLNRNVKRRIERIDGVSRVDLYGISRKEIRIQLLADRIIAHRVDIATPRRDASPEQLPRHGGQDNGRGPALRRAPHRGVREARGHRRGRGRRERAAPQGHRDDLHTSTRSSNTAATSTAATRSAWTSTRKRAPTSSGSTDNILAEVEEIKKLPEMAGINIILHGQPGRRRDELAPGDPQVRACSAAASPSSSSISSCGAWRRPS